MDYFYLEFKVFFMHLFGVLKQLKVKISLFLFLLHICSLGNTGLNICRDLFLFDYKESNFLLLKEADNAKKIIAKLEKKNLSATDSIPGLIIVVSYIKSVAQDLLVNGYSREATDLQGSAKKLNDWLGLFSDGKINVLKSNEYDLLVPQLQGANQIVERSNVLLGKARVIAIGPSGILALSVAIDLVEMNIIELTTSGNLQGIQKISDNLKITKQWLSYWSDGTFTKDP